MSKGWGREQELSRTHSLCLARHLLPSPACLQAQCLTLGTSRHLAEPESSPSLGYRNKRSPSQAQS